jgi:hypothetical protein
LNLIIPQLINLAPTTTPTPISIHELALNSTIEVNRGTTPDSMCSICLDDLEDGCIVRQLNVCEHRFHLSCLDRWVASNTNCPFCRTRIIERPAQATTPHT